MTLRVTLALVLGLVLCPQAQAQPCMPQCVVAGGGRGMTGSGMSIAGTLGQPVIGMALSPGQSIWHGFWFSPLLFVSSTDERDGAAVAFGLEPAHPNPFSDATLLRFGVPTECHLDLRVYDIGGREVAALVNGTVGPGLHSVALSAARLPSGVYYCRLKAGSRAKSIRLVVLK